MSSPIVYVITIALVVLVGYNSTLPKKEVSARRKNRSARATNGSYIPSKTPSSTEPPLDLRPSSRIVLKTAPDGKVEQSIAGEDGSTFFFREVSQIVAFEPKPTSGGRACSSLPRTSYIGK